MSNMEGDGPPVKTGDGLVARSKETDPEIQLCRHLPGSSGSTQFQKLKGYVNEYKDEWGSEGTPKVIKEGVNRIIQGAPPADDTADKVKAEPAKKKAKQETKEERQTSKGDKRAKEEPGAKPASKKLKKANS